MLRSSSLKKLTDEVIAARLGVLLEPLGFNYLKSRQAFKKMNEIFDQIIYIGNPHDPLAFNDKKDELILKFTINVAIESPRLDKWVENKLKSRCWFRHDITTIEGMALLDFSVLEKRDFFTATESQKFKYAVTTSLVGPDKTERSTLASIESRVPLLADELDKASDPIYLYERRPLAFQNHLRLLVFTDNRTLAKDHYRRLYQTLVGQISKHLEEDMKAAKEYILSLEELIIESRLLLGMEFGNPYSRDISGKAVQNQKIRLGQNLGYEETLRIDLSMVDVSAYQINDKGEVLLLLEKDVLKKLDANGACLKTWEIKYPECFEEPYNSKIRWDESAYCFIFNNFIITDNNELIELRIDIDITKYKERSINRNLRDLVYDPDHFQYYTLYSPDQYRSILSVYDVKGKLMSSKAFDGHGLKINLEKKQIFFLGEGNSIDIWSFDGTNIKNVKHGRGNNRIALSPDGSKCVLHFYSPKSHLHDLNTNEVKVLWAHPTFLKGYKEKFYHDINHNFGLTVAHFTPDGKHIIGGADHGKYVMWDIKTLSRTELIPNKKAFKIFNWYTTTFINGQARKNYFHPYVTELEGQELFINRGYDISKISFVDNGDYIITQHSDCLLTWNKEFHNIGFVYGIGGVIFSSRSYLAVLLENDLVLFKRRENFNNSFTSSVFKEFHGEDSSIQYVSVTPEGPMEKPEEKVGSKIPKTTESKKGFFRRLFRK